MKRFVFLLAATLFLFSAFALNAGQDWESAANSFWAKRDHQPSLLKAIEIYESTLASLPDDEKLLVRLSIAYYWKGNNMLDGSDKSARQAAYLKGMDYASRVCKISPDSAGGNFWYATNMASNGREKGILKSVSLLPEIRKRVELVLKVDKFYYYGGPQRLNSRIITKAPGFLRSKFGYTIEDAEKMLKEAIARYPNFTMTHIFLADVYIEMKQTDKAKTALEKVLSIPENSMPAFAPENRRDKKAAKARLAKMN